MLIQVFKRIRGYFNKIICYTNIHGKQEIWKEVKNIDFIVSPIFFDKLNLLINYILRTLKALCGVLFVKDIDIIYSGSDFFPDVLPSFFYKIFNKKIKWVQCIFHIYPDWKTRPWSKVRSFIAQYIQKFSFVIIKKYADLIININTQVKDELIKKWFDPKKIIVDPPWINFEYLDTLKVSKDIKKYEWSFLARLNPSKGIFDLVNIWRIVVEEIPNARLALIWWWSENIKNQLTNLINKYWLQNNIDVLGFLENEKTFSIIKKSNVLLFPSHEEWFGIVIAEAMVCNTSVVSWDLPVFDEIFEDYIMKIEKDNIDLFAKKVIDLLRDKNKRQIIENKWYKFVKKYSWDGVAKKTLEIIDK